MKKYIGVKEIDAEFAIRGEGFLTNVGYSVVCEDGYRSWSPRDTFEKAYREVCDRIDSEGKTLQPHQERVVNEAVELKEKMIKLMSFACNNNAIYERLKDIEKIDLKQQLLAMQYYLTILTSRINRF